MAGSLRPDAEWIEGLLFDGHGIAALIGEGGKVTRANAAAKRILGPGLIGEPLFRFFDGPSRAKLAAASRGAPVVCELQVARNGFEPTPVSFVVLPAGPDAVVLAAGASDSLFRHEAAERLLETNSQLAVVLRETSKSANEQERARDSLEALGALRYQFIAALSEEFRHSFAEILRIAEALESAQEPALSRESKEDVTLIRKHVGELSDLADKVLAIARPETGNVPLEALPVSLREVVVEAIEAVRARAAELRVDVELRSEPPEPLVIGDRVELVRVVANLLKNALRHSPPGGRVFVETATQGGSVSCAVSDEGPVFPSSFASESSMAPYRPRMEAAASL